VQLRGREGLVLFSSTALLGMLVMLVSKERVAELAIQVRREGGREGRKGGGKEEECGDSNVA
jgi:hypothetical protein